MNMRLELLQLLFKVKTYFHSFGVANIPKELKQFLGDRNIKANIRIQAFDSWMCGYCSIGFIKFMFNNKALTNFTSLFSLNNFFKTKNLKLNILKKFKIVRAIEKQDYFLQKIMKEKK